MSSQLLTTYYIHVQCNLATFRAVDIHSFSIKIHVVNGESAICQTFFHVTISQNIAALLVIFSDLPITHTLTCIHFEQISSILYPGAGGLVQYSKLPNVLYSGVMTFITTVACAVVEDMYTCCGDAALGYIM